MVVTPVADETLETEGAAVAGCPGGVWEAAGEVTPSALLAQPAVATTISAVNQARLLMSQFLPAFLLVHTVQP